MRLYFPQGEHRELQMHHGEYTIGSDVACAVRLNRPAIEAFHAALILDARGITLSVLTDGAAVAVNGRPVRSKAILRLGDVLKLAAIEAVIRQDESEVRPAPAQMGDEVRGAVSRAAVRVLSGPHRGRTLTLGRAVTIGSDSENRLVIDEPGVAPYHARIDFDQRSIALRDLGSADGLVVNGIRVRSAQLSANDQIWIGSELRLIVDAPGFRNVAITEEIEAPSGRSATGVMRKIELSDLPPAPAPATESVDPAAERVLPAAVSAPSSASGINAMAFWLLVVVFATLAGVAAWWVRQP